MPTGSEANGSSRPEQNGSGPFDLSEMERLANDMFRALPGGILPGLDPEQLLSVPLPTEVEAARPLSGAIPNMNGEVTNGVVPAVDQGALTLGSLGLTGPWSGERLLEPSDWPLPEASLPTASEPIPAPPAPLPPSAGSGLFALTGDPMSLLELGLEGVPRGAVEDPFAGSYYFLSELTKVAEPAPTASGFTSLPPTASPHAGFDAHEIRRDFPALSEPVHGRPLIWLDNGATTQKPEAVIERLNEFYRHENSNIHRGAHEMAARATDAYEAARDSVARFLNAPSSEEIVFVRGTTEAINLVAQAWGHANVGPGDEILITWLEHHANIVPWQQLCESTGAKLCVVPVDDTGRVMLDEYQRLLSERTKIVAFSHVSNALGTITPAREMTELAHAHGARVLIDGAQAVSHMPVDVQALDADWYAFSGHKVFGPTGIGVLYGKRELLNSMPPWQGGGNMIQDVTFERTLYQPAPVRFEAGTTSIADAVALGTALEYLQRIGRDNLARHEHELLAYATRRLLEIPGLTLIGTAPDKAGVLSFVLDGLTPEAVGEALDRDGIAVRAGHHCAQPIVRRFGHEGTVRASLALYNTCEDIDALIDSLRTIATRAAEPTDGMELRRH